MKNQTELMELLPFEIPQSLATYVEQFESDPQAAVDRLEKQLHRRGSDAVGHFLMSWFHFNMGDKEEAISYALKAKTFAPGSPFLEYLHYYLIHPEKFKAWIPADTHRDSNQKPTLNLNVDIIHDLENLIRRLSEAENKKITINLKDTDENVDLSVESQAVDNIASETLADIYTNQGKFDEAIKIYKLLMSSDPEKRPQYQKQIKELEVKKTEA